MGKTNSCCIQLIVIYHSHSQSKVEFLTEFRGYVDTLGTTSGRLLLVKDFNLHVDENEDINGIG